MKTVKSYKRPAFLFSLLILALITWPSCEKAEPMEKEAKKIVLNKKAAEILQADRQFAFELFKEVHGLSGEENLMISPLSTSYALGMTLNGAAGDTREAFRQVLHFDGLSDQEVNESYQDLMAQLVTLDNQVQFSIANSIWYKPGYRVLEDFISTNREYFDAAVEELDFADPEAVDIINGWIEDKTNDKIREMLDYIPGDAVMYLINAIYFNATWKYQFDTEESFENDFHLEEGGTHRCDFMQVEGTFNYTSQEGFKAVELPYGDSAFSMVVLLPEAGISINSLVDELNAESWDTWFNTSYPANILIQLPKFKYGFKSLLNDPLIDLGLGIAFNESADFTHITPGGGIFISRVIHQTFIDVNEEGTEAAAATIVEMVESTAPRGPLTFRADKPFLYVIRENSTGALLFMGKVGRPEYESD
ncbi:MAG: serpin family protein [Bacteroidales bacterium]|nr:serpin family protein [Bacteroidales bacterium]